ncbi:traf-type zinc finger family protein [Stylonychia lemnae]|uniref:Traf-type zinc finger family protein n=1 Tax=Stylonychia lemnae TaxID=5949 RepID=A0A078APE4_STYLE|nr:traf-type zinc finger family protein [Stylonychia lemnae]|eukprot:CDW83187.1 traf-type zinc finger family protein [Stylonychia lemnae]
MAENYMISDSRIVNMEEIQDIKDYILCGICYQVVTEEREPVECNKCHNQLFCSQCISGWAKTNQSCPYCHAGSAQYVDISPLLLNMIKGIKYFCQFQSKGCGETHSMKTLMKHEFQCSYGLEDTNNQDKLTECAFCRQALPSNQDYFDENQAFLQQQFNSNEEHFCVEVEKSWCHRHREIGMRYDESRIANLGEFQRYFELFKCNLCHQLLRNPQACKTCKINYCKHCISNQLILRNACPSCYQPNPSYSKIPRNLFHLLSRFKIYCKNKGEGCNEILLYESVEKHENTCRQCLLCKVKCLKCEQVIQIEDQPSHQCHIKLNQVQDAIYDAPVLDGLENSSLNSIEDNDHYHQEHGDFRQRMSYCKRMKKDTQQYVSQCPFILTMIIMLIDFAVQNALLTFYILYYIFEDFINEPTRRAQLAFTIIYFIVTFIPFYFSVFTPTKEIQVLSQKLGLMIGCLLSAHFLFFIFGPFVSGFRDLNYRLRESMIESTICRNIAQIFIQVTFITILAINEVDTAIKGLTIGLSSFLILWNVVVCITINFKQ